MNIQQLNPVTDQQVAAMVSAESRAYLAEAITKTDPNAATGSGGPATPRRWRLLVGVPVTAVLAVGTFGIVSVAGGTGPVGPQTANAAPLSIAEKGGYLTVRVTNPNVDPARYRTEFAAYGLNVDLRLQAAGPHDIGRVLFLEDDGPGSGVQGITATNCKADACDVGIKIPLHYKWFVRVIFGRAPHPHDSYQSGSDVVINGVTLPTVRGATVAHAQAQLASRHFTDISYRYEDHGSDLPYPDGIPASEVQAAWYVHDYAQSDIPGQVILFVGPT